MHLTPDHIVFFRWGVVHLNATIVCTWSLIALLTTFSWLLTSRLAGPEEPAFALAERHRSDRRNHPRDRSARFARPEPTPIFPSSAACSCLSLLQSAGGCSGMARAHRIAFHYGRAGDLGRCGRAGLWRAQPGIRRLLPALPAAPPPSCCRSIC